jgi:hypothetical protein
VNQNDNVSNVFLKGYLVGRDPHPKVPGQYIWKVRVRDNGSPHDGKKARVSTFRTDFLPGEDDTGTDVSFRVATRGKKGKTLRAFDVAPLDRFATSGQVTF